MKKPKIRFKGFNDDWEQRKLNEICNYKSSSLTVADRTEQGKFPLYDANGQIGMVDSFYMQEDYITVIKDGAGVGRIRRLPKNTAFIGTMGALTSKNSELNFLYYLLEKKDLSKQYTGSTIPHIYFKDYGRNDVLVSDIKEQQKIGLYFDQLDHLITLHQRKCDEIKKLKKYMLQNMFPQNDEKVPKIRFDGFTDDWEQRKVSDVAEIIAGGTPKTSVLEYWNPKEVPWLSSGEVHKKYITYTDDKISKKGLDHSSAKIIKENSVLIALAGQGKTRGTVAINRIPLSTNQSIAAMIFNDNIVPEFIFSNLDNRYNELRRISSGDGSRGGLNKLLIGNIIIPYTDKLEQDKIGQFFSLLDHLITLHQRKCDELKNMKKFMLQNMFV